MTPLEFALAFVESGEPARIAVDPENACSGGVCEVLARAVRDLRAEVELLNRRDGIILVEDGATWKARAEAAEARVKELERAIEDAPHGDNCAIFADWDGGIGGDTKCDCWKSRTKGGA